MYAWSASPVLAAAAGYPNVVERPGCLLCHEAGSAGFYMTGWLGVWAPKGTPQNAIAKLNSAIVTALADPTVRMRLADIGFEIFSGDQQTAEALAAYQKAEIEKWWPIIKAAGTSAE
jgi:tripartite-type tricarboxylate transporter receptor subunit TctC